MTLLPFARPVERPCSAPSVLVRLIFAAALALTTAGASRATTVIAPTFDELVNQSDYIVRAVVKSVTAEERVTPEGSKTIYSKVQLEVSEVVAGTPPATVVLEVLGGTYGGRELTVEGAPKFTVGEDAIFFVQGNGRQFYPLVRIMHGIYPVEKEPRTGRSYMARSDGMPLVDVNEVSNVGHAAASADRSQLALSALTPAEFVTKIRAAAHETHLLEHHTL